MSYLNVPRLHFAGLFYTGPSTINNTTSNYMTSTQLDPNDVGWNPTGVAQWWLERCSVLSAVDSSGNAITSSSTNPDPVIGVAVITPSPSTPMSDGNGGHYDIAKLVDLDPDMQMRSAVYGIRISVTLANGAGFQAAMTVPELRQMGGASPFRLRNCRPVGARSARGWAHSRT